MRIYLAHNYEAQEYLKNIRLLLEQNGHKVTSSWIDCKDTSNGGNRSINAHRDLLDIISADWVLFFSEDFNGKPGRGKWVEFGYALGLRKRITIIGDEQKSIFLTAADEVHESVEEFLSIEGNKW